MIKINGKEFRNPQEQLAYNTEEIEKLKETIKDAYKTSSTLTSSSVSDTRANTNVPEGVKSAWLMTSDGLLFKITGNDGTTLLLTYYSDLKGPQGTPGAAVSIDDNSTSDSKCWSSNKTSSVILFAQQVAMLNNTIFYTSTEPVLNGDYYEITRDDLINPQGLDNIQYATKQLIYLDSDNQPTTIYSIKHMNEMGEEDPGTIKLIYRGTFAKGKQLYEHNIQVIGSLFVFSLTIINDSSTEINTGQLLLNYLNNNNFNTNDTLKTANGWIFNGSDKGVLTGIRYKKTVGNADGIAYRYYDESSNVVKILNDSWPVNYISNVYDVVKTCYSSL